VAGSTLTLNWGASSGCPATTYVIEAGSSAGASNLANLPTGSAATSFSANSVPNGTYFIRVRGGNASGFGGASNEVTVTIGGGAPPGPSAPGGVLTGRWLGLVANGDGLTSTTFGLERWDWQFDLNQSGNSVSGTLTQTDVLPCRDAPNCRVGTGSITGTVSGNTFSFVITHDRGTINGTATFTSSRMTGSAASSGGESATLALNKQ
jgi:hypothetical protein